MGHKTLSAVCTWKSFCHKTKFRYIFNFVQTFNEKAVIPLHEIPFYEIYHLN